MRREYPGSKYRFQALFTIGQIYKQDLGDDEAARKTFDEFLAHYPRNSLAPEAKKALAELNRPKPAKKPVEEAHDEPSGACNLGNCFPAGDSEEAGAFHGNRHPSLVNAGLHPRGHRH